MASYIHIYAPPSIAPAIARTRRGWPEMVGAPVRCRLERDLRVRGRRLVSGGQAGVPVHAGSHMRRRVITLDAGLQGQPAEFARILTHEIFHFVWMRLSNSVRRSFEALLAAEVLRGARGELGWSAELRKRTLTTQAPLERTRRWRDYVCESFCDTAAFLFSGCKRHLEYTLAARWRVARHRWFEELVRSPLKA